MPSMGFRDAKGAISLTTGACLIVTMAKLRGLPTVWATPQQVKEMFTGNPSADKKQMMAKACKKFDWEIEYKPKYKKGTKDLIRKDPCYHVMGKVYPASYFEHIADAIAAYYACKYLSKKEKKK